MPGPGFQWARLPKGFPVARLRPASPCFQGTGAFRLLPNFPPGLQASMLSGAMLSGGLDFPKASRWPCFQGLSGARGPEARSQGPGFRLSGFQGTGHPHCFQGTRARLSGYRAPGPRMRFFFYNIHSSCCKKCKLKIAPFRCFFACINIP